MKVVCLWILQFIVMQFIVILDLFVAFCTLFIEKKTLSKFFFCPQKLLHFEWLFFSFEEYSEMFKWWSCGSLPSELCFLISHPWVPPPSSVVVEDLTLEAWSPACAPPLMRARRNPPHRSVTARLSSAGAAPRCSAVSNLPARRAAPLLTFLPTSTEVAEKRRRLCGHVHLPAASPSRGSAPSAGGERWVWKKDGVL